VFIQARQTTDLCSDRQGEPVEGATVVFVPSAKGAASAAGVTDAEGYYELTTFTAGDGAQVGKYLVKVTKYDVKKPDGTKEQRFVTHEEEQATYVEDTTPAPPPKNVLPAKYETETTSGIVHTVEDGPTTLDIELE
jgi:hypothetical protein